MRQGLCLVNLAWALYDNRGFDATGGAAFPRINVLPQKDQESQVCEGYHFPGDI